MIRPEHNDRVVFKPVFFQLSQHPPYPGIHSSDQFIVSLPIFPNNRSIGIVGRQGSQFRRILTLLDEQPFRYTNILRIVRDPGLVTSGEIENAKKWLIWIFAIAPVCLAIRVIPSLRGRLKLVILLTVIRAIVTTLPQVSWKGINFPGEPRIASHMMRTKRRLVHSRDDTAPTRGAYTGSGKCMRITNSFRCKDVNVGRHRMGITVATDCRTNIFTRQPQDVGSIRSSIYRRHSADGGKKCDDQD